MGSSTKMILIAHRGLITGPGKEFENKPAQIETALAMEFDCEVDVWFKDSEWWLGHDGPTYLIDFEFLEQPGLWIHAKNLSALYVLSNTELNYFWHQEDDFTLTSRGYIWTYPGKQLSKNSIMVMPEWNDSTLENARSANCAGVCSDFIGSLR
jgi:hypothetical protein